MPYRESDIVREGERYTIIRRAVGRYELLRHELTHSVVCGWFTFPKDDARALAYANREFERKESAR